MSVAAKGLKGMVDSDLDRVGAGQWRVIREKKDTD